MTITIRQEDVSSDLYHIYNDQSVVGSCKLYLSGCDVHHMHIDEMIFSQTVSIKDFVDALQCYAQSVHCRVIEYPWIYVYDDSSYHSDFFATVHVLVDDVVSTRKDNIVKITMGFSKEYICNDNKDIYSFYSSEYAMVHKTKPKNPKLWLSKAPHYDKVVDFVNVHFVDPLITAIPCPNGLTDLYVSMSIGNTVIDTWSKSEFFRLNKWRSSNIESYNIFYGHNNICSYKLFVINDLKFLGEDINTTNVYNSLEPFAQLSNVRYKVKKKFCVYMKKPPHFVVEPEVCALENIDLQTPTPQLFGYIYLIREREFLQGNQNVYKVGQTIQKGASLQLRRLQDYKKGSELCFVRQLQHGIAREIETKIKREFSNTLTKHPDGHEYFFGDMESMIDVINKHCNACR
jgi:hypothetical protein